MSRSTRSSQHLDSQSESAIYTDRGFQAFFTDAAEIREQMMELLGDVSGKTLLEPCAGEGAFLRGLNGIPSQIDAVDIDRKHVNTIAAEFAGRVNALQLDFIDSFVAADRDQTSALLKSYDSVVCNPPYGLKFSREYRQTIKSRYPFLYARESYGLFLFFGINALAHGGRFVYIVPDTFFTSRNHRPLREFLAENTSLTDIIQFDSRRFESVSFGYGSLCILAGNRVPARANAVVRWSDARNSRRPLADAVACTGETVQHSYFMENSVLGWTHPAAIRAIRMSAPATLLGEIAECRTGIYTGDNRRFCAFDASKTPPRANGHAIDWDQSVHTKKLSDDEKRAGLACACNYVPLVRGGHRHPFEVTRHAVLWSRESVKHYADDKKARLQNHSFYFRSGLGVPMVTSGRLSASLICNSVFDQGVVGVFPNDPKLTDFLLIYLNSRVATDYKALISPGANNSANYMRRLPVPVVSNATLREATDIVAEARIEGWDATRDARDAFIDAAIAT